jgi:hypothetical protein
MEQIAAINDMSFGEVCDRFLDRTLDAKLCKRIAEIAMRRQERTKVGFLLSQPELFCDLRDRTSAENKG